VMAAVACIMVAAPDAGAAVVPTWDAGAGRLSIRMTGSGDRATVARDGDRVAVRNTSGAVVLPAGPDIDAVAQISVIDASGGSAELVIDLGGGRFERSAGSLQFVVDLGSGLGTDTLRVRGELGTDNIRLGRAGINLDAYDDAQLDVPSPLGVERWVVEGRGGKDLVSAHGGFGTGGPMLAPVVIVGGPGGGVFGGGAGADAIHGGSGNDQLMGDDGNDVLTGGGGSDRYSGMAGDDVIENQATPDALDGGSGHDTLTHPRLAAGVRIDLANTVAQDTGAAGVDTISGIEAVVGTPFADVLRGNDGTNGLAGGGGSDILQGRSGDDRLAGGDGDDALAGDRGEDTVDGGTGRDVVDYASSPGGVSVRLHAGGGSSNAAPGRDTLLGIEDVTGSPHNDTLTGSDGDNRLYGGDGRDHLTGGGGRDILDGGVSDDTIDSADGIRDRVTCGEGIDRVARDRADAVATDCERAHRKDTSTRLRVLAVTYRGRARRVRVRLACPASAQFACRGAIGLRARLHPGRRSRLRRAGRARYRAILSGRRRSTIVKVRPAVSRAIRRGRGRYRLHVAVSGRDDARHRLGVKRVVRVRRR
jgi:Ca2+-binding RTX toxin-like protein